MSDAKKLRNMTRPQIVLEINQVLEKVKILKEHAVDFVKWMQAHGITISLDGLVNMDRIIAGKRLAEYYQEYRKTLKHTEDFEGSDPLWNKQVDMETSLDNTFLNEFLGIPLPEDFLSGYLSQIGEDTYENLKSKILAFMEQHQSCTLREMCLKIQENVVDVLVITLLLAQKGKLNVWQNEPYGEVFIVKGLYI